jgi:hypothetical protein
MIGVLSSRAKVLLLAAACYRAGRPRPMIRIAITAAAFA